MVKRLSTEELLRLSDEIIEEMKKDLMDLGIDLDKPIKPVYQNKPESSWLELFLDNKQLRKQLDMSLNIVKMNLDTILIVQSEKEFAHDLKEQYIKTFLEFSIESLWTNESILNKLENEKYLSKNKIIKYRNMIQEFRDGIRLITKELNLGI